MKKREVSWTLTKKLDIFVVVARLFLSYLILSLLKDNSQLRWSLRVLSAFGLA